MIRAFRELVGIAWLLKGFGDIWFWEGECTSMLMCRWNTAGLSVALGSKSYGLSLGAIINFQNE